MPLNFAQDTFWKCLTLFLVPCKRRTGASKKVRKWFQLLECKTQSFQERRQQRVPTGTNSYNGRGRCQPVEAVQESTGIFSRKVW